MRHLRRTVILVFCELSTAWFGQSAHHSESGGHLEGDVMREQKPKLSIAAGYTLNTLALRSGGQLGKDLMGRKN